MRRTHRHGFTVFDLLVVLAILGFLLGLLLPIIQRVRESAARMQSANNMKQIGLACHNYYDLNNFFPPGLTKQNFSAHAHILPYIEQANVYNQLDFTKAIDAEANAQWAAVRIPTYVNPQDPLAVGGGKTGPTSYLFNAGSKYDLKNNDGIFFLDSRTGFQQVTDGTSNTLMTGETLLGGQAGAPADPARVYVELGKDALKNLDQKSGVDELRRGRSLAYDRGSSWIDGRFLQGTFTGTRVVNDERPDVGCGGRGGLSGLRGLTGTVNIGLCDGSVRAVTDRVSLEVWGRLAAANDGQPVPPF